MHTRRTIVKKGNYFKEISKETFGKAKAELLFYLQDNNDIVMRDHCHFTGRFRGAAHQFRKK